MPCSKRKKPKKALVAEYTIDDLLPIGLTIAILGIVLSFTGDVQDDIRFDQGIDGNTCPTSFSLNASDPTACYNATATTTAQLSAAWNISTYGMQGSETVAKKMPTIAKVVIAGVIIGILIRFMAFGKED